MKPLHVLLLLELLLVPCTRGQDAPEPPAAPSLPAAAEPDAWLAEVEGRRQDAVARSARGRDALAGEMPLEDGFPQLAGKPLDSVAWIAGRLGELDQRGTERAAERQAELPAWSPDIAQERREELRTALGAALDAALDADSQERELLFAVLAHLEAHPQLTRKALAPIRRDHRSRFTAHEDALDPDDEASRQEGGLRVAAVQHAIDRLEDLLRDLRRHAVAGAPPPSPEEDIALLDDAAAADDAARRLGLLSPFLAEADRAAVRTALAERTETATATPPPPADPASGPPDPSDDEPTADRYAELNNEADAAQGRLKNLGQELERRKDEADGLETGFRHRYLESEDEAAEIAELPSSLGAANERRKRTEKLYGDLRQLVEELREEVAQARALRIEAEGKLAAVRADDDQWRDRMLQWESSAPAPGTQGPRQWREAIEKMKVQASALAQLEENHSDRVFVLLKDAQRLRLAVEDDVSAEARRNDRRFLLADLKSEGRLTLPLLTALLRHRWQTVLELPRRGTDLRFLGNVAAASFWGLVTLVFWWATRRRAPRAVPGLLRFWAARSRQHVPRDLWTMRDSAERTLVAVVDLTAIGVLLQLVESALPELGLVLLVWLQVALYRVILGLASLAFAAHPEVRPALVTLRPKARDLALRTVRYVVLWLILGQFLRYFALEVLGAVTLHTALGVLFGVVLLGGLGVWVFHSWEPYLRDALRRRDPVHPVVRFQTGRELRLLRFVQGLAHTLLYTYLWVRDLVGRLGGWGSILQPWRLGQAGDASPEKPAALPGDVVKQLFRRECTDDGYTGRTAPRQELDQCFERWRVEKRRGVVMVLGDEGMGKRVFLDRWHQAVDPQAPDAEDGDLRDGFLHARLRERLTTRNDALRWLATLFEIEATPADEVALATRIKSRPGRQVVIVEALQFAFLRRVDGFAALSCLLTVMASTSEQTFWVLSMHRPAWRYLDSLDGLVHTEVCQRVIDLAPFSEDELRRILEQRTAVAEHRVSFFRLLPRGVRWNPDPLAVERVTAEYFRRLTWASQGNPAVALRLWRETLVRGPRTGELLVSRYTQSGALPDLRDVDLFLLAAIHTHRSLTKEELVAVTDMSPAQVSTAVRNLEGRWLLVTRSKRFSIDPRYLPAVTDHLRRRHFIHGST